MGFHDKLISLLQERLDQLLTRLVGKPGTLRNQIGRGSIGTFLLKIAQVGLGFLTSLMLARILGAKSYGAYAYAISWVAILVVPAMIGFPILLTREVARYKTRGDWGSLRGILLWSDRVVLGMSLGLMLLAAVVLWVFHGGIDNETATALLISLFIVPVLALMRIKGASLRGLGYVVLSQLPQMVLVPILFLISAGAYDLIIGLSPPAAIALRASVITVALFASVGLLAQHLPSQTYTESPEIHHKQWLKSNLPLFFFSISNALNQQISVIMAGSMVNPEAAGMLDVARRGLMLLTLVHTAMNMPLSPMIASLYSSKMVDRLQQVITRSARVILAGSVPIALGFILFGGEFLALFGDEFRRAESALLILTLGGLVFVSMGSVGPLLNMTGYDSVAAAGVGLGAFLNLSLNVILTPIWGINGVAAATAISMAASSVFLAWQVSRILGICPTAIGRIHSRQDD